MSVGQLRERVSFEKRGTTDDGYGGTIGSDWTQQFAGVSARIRPHPGREQVLQARLAGIQPVIITVRYSSQTKQIEPDWRARDERSGVIYAIKSIDNRDERKRYFEITAVAGEAA